MKLRILPPRAALAAALAVAFFPAAPSHAAPATGRTPLHLSAQTLNQIDALERDADARTPVQRKISSQLLYALKAARGEQIVPGIQALRTTAKIDSRGMTLVDMDAAVTPELLYAITRAGGTVVNTSERFGAVRANVPLASVEVLAAVPGVRFIKPAVITQTQNPMPLNRSRKIDFLAPFVLPVPERVELSLHRAAVRAQLIGLLARVDVNPGAATPAVGSVVDEADKTHRADLARSTFGADGTGIKVGVLSDSIDDGNGVYADAVNSGDVSPVTVISGQDGGNGTAEGLAMLEDVHHLAPGAKLYFATGNGGDAKFADNIIALQKAGCKIILDDLFEGDDPPFQDGVISQAVNTVTAAGVMYFSCTANYGHLGANTASVWEGDYKDSGDTSFGDGDIHTFDSSQGVDGEGNQVQIPSPDGKTLGTSVAALFWSDPLGKSSNDYDLIILDSGFNVVGASTDRQTGSQDPIEAAQVTDGNYVDIVRHSGSTRFLHLDLLSQNSIMHFVTNGRVRGHNATANAFCIAATPAAKNQDGNTQGPYPNPFNSSDVVETFSSDGPRRMFYDPSGHAYTSSLTHTGGIVLNKPDFTAADGTSNTLTASEVGTNPDTHKPNEVLSPFFGTSCATPHAGAIGALVLSRNPALTRSQLATILDKSVTDIMDTGYDYDAGYGILDAYKALQNTTSSNTVKPKSITFTPNPVVGGQGTTGTITLTAAAPSGGAAVTITENGSAIGTITVPAGSTSTTFTLTPPTVTATETDTIGAVYNGTTVTTSLTVTPAAAAAALSSLSFSPTTVVGGSANTTGTVTLTANAPSGGAVVSLSSSTSAITFSASTVTVAAGSKTATFRAYSHTVTSTVTATITAKLNGASKTATVKVTPAAAAATLTALSFNPTTVVGGSANTTGTVTLSAAAPSGGAVVSLKSSTSAITFSASTVTVAAGATTATFRAYSHTVTSTVTATITATLAGVSKTATVKVTTAATTAALSKLAFSPSSISSDSITTGTVTLTAAAPSGGAAVTISYQGSTITTATVPAGSTSTSFVIHFYPVSSTTTYSIDAIYKGVTKSANVTVSPTTVTLTKLALSPSTITSGSATTITVTLSAAAPTGGAAVEIYQGTTDLGYIAVSAGQTTAAVSYTPPSVSSQTKYTMKATYNNVSKTATLTLNP